MWWMRLLLLSLYDMTAPNWFLLEQNPNDAGQPLLLQALEVLSVITKFVRHLPD